MQPSIKELLDQQKQIRENAAKPKKKPGRPKKVKEDAEKEEPKAE